MFSHSLIKLQVLHSSQSKSKAVTNVSTKYKIKILLPQVCACPTKWPTKLANYLKNKHFHVETQTNRGFHNSSTTSPTSTFSSFLLPPWWWDRARGGLTRFNVCSRALRRCCALESWPLESPPPPPRFSHKSAVSPDVCCPSPPSPPLDGVHPRNRSRGRRRNEGEEERFILLPA